MENLNSCVGLRTGSDLESVNKAGIGFNIQAQITYIFIVLVDTNIRICTTVYFACAFPGVLSIPERGPCLDRAR